MTDIPSPEVFKKVILRRNVDEDLEIEERIRSLVETGKIKVIKTVRVTKEIASGASDFRAPSIFTKTDAYIGVTKVNEHLDSL